MQSAKTGILLFTMLAMALYSNCQPAKIDSLKQVVNSNAGDGEKIKAWLSLSNIYSSKNFDDCLNTASSGFQLAQKIKDSALMGEFEKFTGIAYYFKGSYDSAAAFYYRAINLLNKKTDDLRKAGVLNELAKLYRKTRDLDRASQAYEEAYNIYNNHNDRDGMATILNESGVVYEYKGDYEEAISRYKKSLAIREAMNDTVGKAYSLNFLGGVYTLQKKFSEAEKYLLESLALRQQLKDSFAIALSYSDLGAMYNEQGAYDKSIDQYLLSNDIGQRMKYADLLLINFKELAHIEEKKGDLSLSLIYIKKYADLKDSIYTQDKMKQVEELNAKYQTKEKEQQLKLQKAVISQKNYLLWGLSIGLVLLLFSGVSFYRKKKAQNELKLQAEVMKQQDLSVKAIIAAEENERKRIAADLHDGVGQVLSAAKMNLSAFENELPFKNEEQKISFEKIISLVDEGCREIRSVSHQMMPNALLKSGLANAIKEFIDKIDHHILKVNLHAEGLNERLDSNLETVLYRIIQECVNNVIKHAGANMLDISLIKDADGISVTIEDNGRGFDVSDKQKSGGMGLKNIYSRVAFLKGTVDFDSSPKKGTLVAMHFPLS